ncbi:hypothetical protein ABPG75_008580 [Micractinium tetrahymenae]
MADASSGQAAAGGVRHHSKAYLSAAVEQCRRDLGDLRAPPTRPAQALARVDMPWQLLTAHESGLVQVWGHVDARLEPLLLLGHRRLPSAPRADGKLHLQQLPDSGSPAGLSIMARDLNGTMPLFALPGLQLGIGSSGLTFALGGPFGVIAAHKSGDIEHLSVSVLRSAAEEAGVPLLSLEKAAHPRQV